VVEQIHIQVTIQIIIEKSSMVGIAIVVQSHLYS